MQLRLAGVFDKIKGLILGDFSHVGTPKEEKMLNDMIIIKGKVLNDYFKMLKQIKTVEFAENSKLKSIGKGAFQGCDALKEIIIPSSVEIIADYAFEGDYNEGSALEKVTIVHC